ncbi:MAG: aminotransferase class IV [Bacteroidales bacterium]
MANDIRGSHLVIDGIPREKGDYRPDMSAGPLYEVIRVIDGKCLFLDDHLARLRHSFRAIETARTESFPDDLVRTSLRTLLKVSSISEGNVRICLYLPGHDAGTVQEPIPTQPGKARHPRQSSHANDTLFQGFKPPSQVHCYFIPHTYPDAAQYENGVSMCTYRHERPRPGVKKWDPAFRRSVQDFIARQAIYEALLVDPNGRVLEGSRSNVFFLSRDNRVLTPPVEHVLPGITQKHIFALCEKNEIPISGQNLYLSDLNQMTACFLSGTSPKILPVCCIDGQRFDPGHPLLQRLMKAFDTVIHQNLQPC